MLYPALLHMELVAKGKQESRNPRGAGPVSGIVYGRMLEDFCLAGLGLGLVVLAIYVTVGAWGVVGEAA